MIQRFGVLGLAALCLFAQSPTATLVGTVRDASGAIVQGANVGVRNTSTSQFKQIKTGAEGSFTLPNLEPGSYLVTVEHPGFRRLVQSGLVLQVDQAARLDLVVEVGSVSEAVEVHAEPPLLNTENGTKGEVIISDEIAEIPLNGRDVGDLAFLIPGVTPKGEGASEGSPYAVNGARSDNTNFILDGFNNQSTRAGAMQSNPPIDSVQEFKMQTTSYPAEFGRLAGGVMTVVLKSGGNQPHGSLFEYVRNDKLDARNFFNTDKSKLRRNQFGGSLSGPVVIPRLYKGANRTFFVFSWESYRQVQGTSQLSRVPTPLEGQGDFSQTVDANGKLVTVKDPLGSGTSANFAGNRIPLSRFSPVALKLLDYFPIQNRPGQANNYGTTVNSPNSWNAFTGKADQRLFGNDLLSVRYTPRTSEGLSPYAGSSLGTFGSSNRGTSALVGIGYTHLFNPGLIDEARAGFSRTTSRQFGVHTGQDIAGQIGMPPGPTDPSLIGFPLFSISGEAALGDSTYTPILFTVNVFDYSNTLTWVHSRHLMKFGGAALRTQFFQPYTQNIRGTFNFTGKVTNVALSDFLLGFPNTTTRQVGTTNNYLLSTSYGFFVQDDYKVSGNLTMNLGLRYEISKPPAEKYDRLANFIPALGKVIFASDSNVPNLAQQVAAAGLGGYFGLARDYGLPRSLVYTNYGNFAPRIGFAWRPFGGSGAVIRGGYGVYYSGNEWNPMRGTMADVYPLAIAQTFNRQASNPTLLSLSNPFPGTLSSLTGTTNVGAFEVHPAAAYLQTWNFTMERELGHEMAITAAYEGSKGTHLSRSYNANQPYRLPQFQLPGGGFPSPFPMFSTVTMYGFGSNSDYHAMVLTARRRLARGFFYRASYVWGKSIDDASAISNSGMSTGSASGAQDARNLALEHGRSDTDIRHGAMFSFVYESQNRSRLIRGWQLAGSGVLYSGRPFSPATSGANLGLGEASRPDRVAFGTVANPSPDRWFDIRAFPVVPDGAYRPGNAGRNILDGPGRIAANVALMRKFQIREKSYFQFRWEVFNLTNHANFNLPDKTVNTLTSATITGADAARVMQFALRFMF